jgi:2,4-dienoyl-CoA reductase-like NADH-dependent reductase (Old Yellow Enzyme family)
MWREVVERCHKKGAVVFLQVWALGRANKGESGIKVVSSGDVSDPKTGGGVKPTPLSKDDIKRYVAKFARCCKLAREAGIDGVELHGARERSFALIVAL